MPQLRATAPGKLILAGEYAVLQGGPAIAMAVGRRAEVLLTTHAPQSELRIANTGNCYEFELTDSGLRWQSNPAEHGELFEAAVTILGESGIDLSKLMPFSLQLCTRSFYAADDAAKLKLGLGSSAALAVALSGCLQQAAGGQAELTTALAAHRKFQGGQGSGIDVRASYCGGTISIAGNGAVKSLVWPDPLRIVPVWTGRSASTPTMLQQLRKFAAANPDRHAELLATLSARSADVLQACAAADVPVLSAALLAFTAELHNLDEATGLGIWSAEHVRLAQLAESAGLIYKPSGAGGGDFGLAFGTDREALTGFQQQAEREGFGFAELELGVNGLEIA